MAVLCFEDFGAVGDGVANDRSAIRAAYAALAAGGARLDLTPGRTYLYDLSAEPKGVQEVAQYFRGIPVYIAFNGSKIVVRRNWDYDTGEKLYLHYFQNCSPIVTDSVWAVQETRPQYDRGWQVGVKVFTHEQACNHIRHRNTMAFGALSVFHFNRRTACANPEPSGAVCEDIECDGWAEDIGYGFLAVHSGWGAKVSLRTKRATRSLFLQGYRRGKFDIISEDAGSQDCWLVCETESWDGYVSDCPVLEDICLHYRALPVKTGAGPERVMVRISGISPGLVQNLDIDAHVEMDPTNAVSLFSLDKVFSIDGVNYQQDIAASRGHTVDGLRLRLRAQANTSASGDLVQIMRGWSGAGREAARNIELDCAITGGSVNVRLDSGSVTDPLCLHRIAASGAITVDNAGQMQLGVVNGRGPLAFAVSRSIDWSYGSGQIIGFDRIVYDGWSCWDGSQFFNVPFDGVYAFDLHLLFQGASSTGTLAIVEIAALGADSIVHIFSPYALTSANNQGTVHFSAQMKLSTGQRVCAAVLSVAEPLNLSGGSNAATRFEGRRIDR
jgi:hypothetical protein